MISMEKIKFEYDKEANSLIIYKEKRTYASIDIGEIIIDLDKNYQLVAVEILNPDKLYKIPKKKFLEISSASMQMQQRGSILWIYIILKFKNKEEINLPVSIPLTKPILTH